MFNYLNLGVRFAAGTQSLERNLEELGVIERAAAQGSVTTLEYWPPSLVLFLCICAVFLNVLFLVSQPPPNPKRVLIHQRVQALQSEAEAAPNQGRC